MAMLEQNDLRGAWYYRVWDQELGEAFDGPALPAVEEDRAVQLWLQRQGWRLQFDPTDIVVNDFMVVHPDVDGDMVTRVFVESAEEWERISDKGFRAGVPDEFDALHFMRKRRGGDGVHVAVVVVNRDTGAAYVEIFTPQQLNEAAQAEPTTAGSRSSTEHLKNVHRTR